MEELPKSIAIAGLGYIGENFLRAALGLGIKPFVYDPKGIPEGIDPSSVVQLPNQRAFYSVDADMFHLALHPEHRKGYMDALLKRSLNEPTLILVEKPMTAPETPEECAEIIDAVNASGATILYDFPELFDPMTRRIMEYLSQFDELEINSMYFERSKDREDPSIERNYIKMLPIQYQESGHTLAFILNFLGNLSRQRNIRETFNGIFSNGITVCAESQPYAPPNPEIYQYVVDGRCDFELAVDGIPIEGHTNFKAGAEPKKIIRIEGIANGEPLDIEADYLEGHKYLKINGVDQGFNPKESSYESVIRALWQWYNPSDRNPLMHGIYPNPYFARLAYVLSGILWRSSQDNHLRGDDGKEGVSTHSIDELMSFDAGFAGAREKFHRYARQVPVLR